MSVHEEIHPGEKIVMSVSPSRWHFALWYLIGILTIPILVGLIVIFVVEVYRRSIKYYVTNKRVIYYFQFFTKKSSSTSFNRIQDVHLSKSIIERILDIGTINVDTAGGDQVEIRFKGVPDPERMKKSIEMHIEHHNHHK